MEHKDENNNTNNIPSPEVRYYQLNKLEHDHSEQQKQILKLINEIEDNLSTLNKELIRHDLRIAALENDKKTHDKYMYGIIILLLTQVVSQVIPLIIK